MQQRAPQPQPPTTSEGVRRQNEALIALLDEWAQEDEQEQQETWEYLQQALDEDRPSNRTLFP